MERKGMLRGVEVVRHHGDPAGEWQAAVGGVALRDRSHRLRLRLHGRSPGAMLKGVVTGRIPAPLVEEGGVRSGRAEYSVVLTPKGRTVTDLRLIPLEPGDDPARALLADVPRAGADALLAHLGRYVPPRMCALDDVSASTGMITVLGPQAAAVLARVALGLRAGPEDLDAMSEDDLLCLDAGGALPLTVVRTCEVAVPAFDLFGDTATLAAVRQSLLGAGAVAVGSGVWEALRLEAGRPAFGDDLTDEHIPVEAGVDVRAIDHTKGCYTGQEVIVRIRDRGHVNRHLRRLRLGDAPVPTAGTQLFAAGSDRVVGEITSAATSPRLGTLALAYVRREIAVPSVLQLGAPDGVAVEVEALPGSDQGQDAGA